MSGDLISRSALLQTLKYTKAITEDENGETRQLIAIDINKMIEYVEKMPTAYDVDKVVEKLHEYQSAFPVDSQNDYFRGVGVGTKSCIEIVKAGGER